MKRYYIATAAVSLVFLIFFGCINRIWDVKTTDENLTVGFIYDNDEIIPYTYNFMLAKNELEKEYGDRVKVYVKSNVLDTVMEEPVRDLAQDGCDIIFTNTYSTQFKQLALQYPDIQFCQTSFSTEDTSFSPANYHTFNGLIYQGRYVSGVAAGMKLRQLIDEGVLTTEQAIVGCVGAFPSAEVISGYTAFLLGVRSIVPEATMRVIYTGTWNSYSKEKACAKALIDAGCVVITQHTDTTAPAVACEEAAEEKQVYHISYNQSMIDVASESSLTGACINWSPYILGAVEALMNGQEIEKYVKGSIHGNDIGAGFDRGWVKMLELNDAIIAPGTQERINKTIDALRKGKIDVFKGDYQGVNPDDPTDTCNLIGGYTENRLSSAPSFHYVLQDIVTVMDLGTKK